MQLALCNLLCASCFRMQVASCDARPRTREESNPRPAGSGSRRTTPEDQFEQKKSRKTPRVFAPRPRRSPQRVARAPQKSQKTSSFCTSTTLIPAQLRGRRRNRKKTWVFAPRPRRSPQRVARELQKSQKTMSFCTSTTPIPAEGRASMLKIAKNLEVLTQSCF